jgi:acylglycerol lipase
VAGTSAQAAPDGVRRVEGFFEPRAAVRLYHCEWWPDLEARAGAGPVVVLMHGFAEHCRRYDEVAEFLLLRGMAVCRIDARGHGRSSGQRGDVASYDDYVSDLSAYVEYVASLAPGRPLALFGHSNGGLIALRTLQRGLPRVSSLVLTNPYLQLRAARKPVPDALAKWLAWGAGRLPLPNGLRPRDLTHDLSLQQAVRRDPWVHRVATPRWYWSAQLAGRAALEEAGKLELPLLVVLGDADPIAEPRAGRALYERVSSPDKQLVLRAGELHEVLNEIERQSLFALIADWLALRS